MRRRRERIVDPQDSEYVEEGADCPNCNASLTQAAKNRELRAVNELENILNQSSASKMILESYVENQDGVRI